MIQEIINLEELNELFNLFFKGKLEKNDFQKYYVYKINNEIIGFIIYSIIYDRCELDYIGIVDKYKNKGYAKKLMNFMIDDCKKNKCLNITLEVNEKNITAINLYKKFNFKEVAKRNNYYGKNNALLMMLEVGE